MAYGWDTPQSFDSTIKKKSEPPVHLVGLIGIQVLAPRQVPVLQARALS
jgi:hypothetical protein